jgi:hypothetical protein
MKKQKIKLVEQSKIKIRHNICLLIKYKLIIITKPIQQTY